MIWLIRGTKTGIFLHLSMQFMSTFIDIFTVARLWFRCKIIIKSNIRVQISSHLPLTQQVCSQRGRIEHQILGPWCSRKTFLEILQIHKNLCQQQLKLTISAILNANQDINLKSALHKQSNLTVQQSNTSCLRWTSHLQALWDTG